MNVFNLFVRQICVTANMTVPNAEQLMARAKHIAEQLGLEVLPNLREAATKYPFTLLVDKDDRLKLQQLGTCSAFGYRRAFAFDVARD